MTLCRIAVPSFFFVVMLGACSGSIEAIVDPDGGSADDAESASDARAEGGVRPDGGHTDGGRDAGSSSDGSSSDALVGFDAADGGTCNALVNGATAVTANQVASVAPPVTGGPIADGIYFLTSITIYTGVGGATGPLGSAEAVTLQLSGSTAQSVVQNGATVIRETATLAATSLTSLTATTTCPSPRSPSTFGYSANLTTFLVQSGSASSTILETFTKQ